jgi:hypothetical protein
VVSKCHYNEAADFLEKNDAVSIMGTFSVKFFSFGKKFVTD